MVSSADTDNAELPWPECLGTFDEESCRYFLRELGRKVVQFYPFSVGMEEVYTQIVDEYGVDGAADAISVLQELLEDESAASGFGDDGDIWRSWRHSWRHRNDDNLNPYVPRVRGRILAPPTTTRIRLLKSTNFANLQLHQAKVISKQRAFHSARSSVASDIHPAISEEPIEIRTAPLGRADFIKRAHYQIQADTFVRPEQDGRGSKHKRNASSGGKEHMVKDSVEGHDLLTSKRYAPRTVGNVAESPRRSLPVARKPGFSLSLVSPKRKSCAVDSRRPPSRTGLPLSSSARAFLEDKESEHRESVSNSPSPVPTPPDAASNERTERTPLSVRLGAQDNRFSLPSDLGSADIPGTPTNRRAAHRQARLIDGALFNGKSRKGKFIESDSIATLSPVKAVNESATKRLSAGSTQPQSPRESWLHNVLTRFRREHNRKSKQPKLRERHSSLADCGMAGGQTKKHSITTNIPSTPRMSEIKHTSPMRSFGFNGANDERNNKPLPLSPDQNRPSIQNDVQRTFFGKYQEPVSIDPHVFKTTPKQEYQLGDDFRSMVSATMAGPQELSPKEKLMYRYSSSSTHSAPSSPKSFSTFAKKNPYRDSSEPSTPNVISPPPLSYAKHQMSSTEWPFRNSLDPSPHHVSAHKPQLAERLHPVQEPQSAYQNQDDREPRGRRPVTPTSPSRSRFGFKGLSPSKTPRTRSRSPVKKLLGMVKSHSTNQIPTAPATPRLDTPASSNRTKWKDFSHKLRHGFLTADLEQLQQEEMMEQYSTPEAIRIITPPASHNRTTFPVSIKSSGQSRMWSELEYMLIETCNTFLKDELEAGRLSRDSVIRVKHQWHAKNRPQVIEFYYDQATQYDLVISNLRTIKLYSDYSQDAIMLNSVLHQWKILVREISVKTLCMPDSIVRRWLHDGRRVLELLGASQITLSHLDRLSSLCLAVISSAEKERAKKRAREKVDDVYGSHRRSVSDGSQNTLLIHERDLMRGEDVPPPLPTPTWMGSASPKVTPQERRIAHQLNSPRQNGESNKEREQFVSKSGHGYSRSLGVADQRPRFPFG